MEESKSQISKDQRNETQRNETQRNEIQIEKTQFNKIQGWNKAPTKDELKNILTGLQYEVTQNNATEPPFRNEYYNVFQKGIYVDITTGEPLFISSDKFESGCGWPSFSKPIDNNLIVERKDHTHGMIRVEVRSKIGNAHLGHVFDDGPRESGGLRYCINSASLRFIPADEMEEKGYGEFIKLLK